MADLQTICVDETCMNNPITSVDSSLSSTSENPVQNRVIKNYLDALEARVAALEECCPCGEPHWVGVTPVTIGQGEEFDPTDGVSAINGQGESVPYTVSPSTLDTCDVDTHTLTYSAQGFDDATRTVTIESISDPTISGASTVLTVTAGEAFDPLDGVSAVDGNGEPISDIDAELLIPTYRTVLYPDGHFIINESSADQAANEQAHGGTASHVYPAWDAVDEPYAFTADGDQPWYTEIDDILSASIGSSVAPTSCFRWFSAMHNVEDIDLTNLDTSNCTTFERMFTQCNSLVTVNAEVLDTSSVTSMFMTFFYCHALEELNLCTWDTSRVTTMNQLFRECNSLVTINVSSDFDTSNVGNSNNMFAGCTSLVGGAGTTYASSPVDKTRAKIDGGQSDPGYFTECSAPPQ